MFRRFITLCLFSITVPLSVFGQDVFGSEHVKNMAYAIRAQWPQAHSNLRDNMRQNLPQSLPKAARGLDHMRDGFTTRDRRNVDFKDDRPSRRDPDLRPI